MNARDATTPLMRPFLPAIAGFSSDADSPREFLERCIATLDAWGAEDRPSSQSISWRRGWQRMLNRGGRAGKPLSPIDGMPIGVKDIMETIDMTTDSVRRCLPASVVSEIAPRCGAA